MKHITDLLIIGAGPVGLFAIFEAGMLKIKCHVIDSLDIIGGQCSALYPEKPIYDIPAHPQISGQELIDQLVKQAAPFNPTYHLNQRAEEIIRNNDNFLVTTSLGTKIEAKAIIIAAGCGAFGPNRPPLENIEQFEEKSIFYMVREKEKFRDQSIAIAGGGDSAIDWALSLAPIAKKIYLIHRRDKFRCAPNNLEQLNNFVTQGKVELVVPYQLSGLKGNNGILEKLTVIDFNNNTRDLDVSVLLAFFGLSMQLGPIADWGLNLDKSHITVDRINQQTNIAGIYAIGDICNYQGKLKLILTGFAEAATAAYSVYHYLNPDKALHFEYSTTKGISNL